MDLILYCLETAPAVADLPAAPAAEAVERAEPAEALAG
jgi:hypothetical protein